MSSVRILSATVENFGSFRRADYPLSDLGLVLVEGRNLDDARTNANGAGKSTLFLDAPTWAFFGESRVGLGADDVVNDAVGKDCAVTVRADVPGVGPVTVQRFRRVSGKAGLRLWVGAQVADLTDAKGEQHRPFERTALDSSATQAAIEAILGVSLDVWRSAVYRAQDDDRRFAALKDSEQKALLSSVFQLDAIDGWREVAAKAAADLERKIATTRMERGAKRQQLAGLGIDRMREADAAWRADRAARVQRTQEQIETLVAQWKDMAARENRRREVAAQAVALRSSPPPPPALEPEPRQPEALPAPPEPREPPRPSRYQPMPVEAPPAIAGLVMPPLLDVSLIEAQERTLRAQAADALAVRRARGEQSRDLYAQAEALAAKQGGPCPECGAPLDVDHARRESVRLRDLAKAAFEHAAQCGQELQAFTRDAEARALDLVKARKLHQEHVAEAVAAHSRSNAERQAAYEAARREAEAAANEQNRVADQAYAAEHQAWSVAVGRLRAQAEGERQRLWGVWQDACASVRARNEAARIAARGDYDARVQGLEQEAKALEYVPAALKEIEASGGREAAALKAAQEAVSPFAADLARATSLAASIEAELAQDPLPALEGDARLAGFWVEGFGPRGLKSFVLDERIQELTDRANSWLKVLTSGIYWLKFETQQATAKGKLIEKFSTRVFRYMPTGRIAERRWGQWSGGQKARVGVGIDLAIADAIAARASRGYDLLVLDEAFRHLDAGGREAMLDALNVLRRQRGTVIVVDHDAETKAAFEKKITVELRNEESRIAHA